MIMDDEQGTKYKLSNGAIVPDFKVLTVPVFGWRY
jgi:hypothetical protein